MLGAEQFAASDRWRDRGLLALVGMGVEPGLSDVFARYAADHLFGDDRRDRRARRRRPRGRGLRLRADVLDLDDHRGVPQPAARLGARARLLHAAAVLGAGDVRVSRGHRADRVRARRARRGDADPAVGRLPPRARSSTGSARSSSTYCGCSTRPAWRRPTPVRVRGVEVSPSRRRGRGAPRSGDARRSDARPYVRGHVGDGHRPRRRAARGVPVPRVRQRRDDGAPPRAGRGVADRDQPGRRAGAARRRARGRARACSAPRRSTRCRSSTGYAIAASSGTSTNAIPAESTGRSVTP